MAIRGAADVTAARSLASLIRAISLEMILESGYGFPASCMSVADALAAIFVCWRPGHDSESMIVMSKGHAAPALYAANHADGWHSLGSYAALHSPLQGHPHRVLGHAVDATSGSLGLAVGFGIGRLLAGQSLGSHARLAVIAGDGELQAGCALEAIAYAAEAARGMCLIIDANGQQSSGAVAGWPVTERMLEAMAGQWGVFDAGETAEILAFLDSVRSDAPFSVAVVRSAPHLGVSELDFGGKSMSYLPDADAVRMAIRRLRSQAGKGWKHD